jgi:hypothetical protein
MVSGRVEVDEFDLLVIGEAGFKTAGFNRSPTPPFLTIAHSVG